MNSRILEVPVDNLESASLAAPHADRLEVCADLSSEGWSPEYDVLKSVVDLKSHHDIQVISLIRPEISPVEHTLEAKHFVATKESMDASIASIEHAGEVGANGVAIGILNPDGSIDHQSCGRLIECARRNTLEVSFLRVFDLTPDRSAAIRILTNIGVDRILTTGMRGWNIDDVRVERRIETLKRDIHTAQQSATSQDRTPVMIMPGGGIRSSNVRDFASISPSVHSSCRGEHGFDVNELIAIKNALNEMT